MLNMDSETNMKQILVKHLQGGQAFLPVDRLLEKISFSQIGVRPAGLPYSFFEIFYHIKFTQSDILEYCTKEEYQAPEWPKDYWPDNSKPQNEQAWNKLRADYFRDREELEVFILSKDINLLDNVPSGEDHSFFREIMLVIEHTSYHSGQLLILLRHLGLHSG